MLIKFWNIDKILINVKSEIHVNIFIFMHPESCKSK